MFPKFFFNHTNSQNRENMKDDLFNRIFSQILQHRSQEISHRNQSINRKGTYILADVQAMDNSTVGAATRLFCGFFLK
jgi:hypothetical protein